MQTIAVFTDGELIRLAVLAAAIREGTVSEETPESKRLEFGRWLYEHGRINEEGK